MTQETFVSSSSKDDSTTYQKTIVDEIDDLNPDQTADAEATDEVFSPEVATVGCQLKDFACEPIEGLKYKLVVNGETIMGKTDSQGNLQTLTDLAPGCYVDVFVFRNYTKDYKHIGSLYSYPGETNYSLVSPKIKFEIETEPHVGDSGNAETDKPPVPEKVSSQDSSQQNTEAGKAKPNKTTQPLTTKASTNTQEKKNTTPPPSKSPIKTGRDSKGNPQATVQDKNQDWLKRIILVALNFWTAGAFQNKTATSKPEDSANKAKGASSKSSKGGKPGITPLNPPPTEKAAATAHSLVNPALPASNVESGSPLPASELQSLNRLIEIAEQQVEQNYIKYKPGGLTTNLLNIFAKGEEPEPSSKEAIEFMGYCLAYVKVALNRAKYITGNSGTENAKDSVKDWVSPKLGYKFKDVSQELPGVEVTYEQVYESDQFAAALEEKKNRTALKKLKEKRKRQKNPISDAEYQAEEAKITHVPTKTLKITQPDLIYTLPGDIIVYDQIDPPKLNAPGHIDIRTYHNFLSDAAQRRVIPPLGVGSKSRYKVIGVFRKISDTMAMARVMAFLRIVREFETEGYSESESYFVLPDGVDAVTGKLVRRKFVNTTTHPFSNDAPIKYDVRDFTGNKNTAAGAYQIKLGTWKETIEATGWPSSFTVEMQQRIAIYRLQFRNNKVAHPRRTALGFIMQGDVENAVNETSLWNEWSWLPGSSHKVKITMDALKIKFAAYVEKNSK